MLLLDKQNRTMDRYTGFNSSSFELILYAYALIKGKFLVAFLRILLLLYLFLDPFIENLGKSPRAQFLWKFQTHFRPKPIIESESS